MSAIKPCEDGVKNMGTKNMVVTFLFKTINWTNDEELKRTEDNNHLSSEDRQSTKTIQDVFEKSCEDQVTKSVQTVECQSAEELIKGGNYNASFNNDVKSDALVAGCGMVQTGNVKNVHKHYLCTEQHKFLQARFDMMNTHEENLNLLPKMFGLLIQEIIPVQRSLIGNNLTSTVSRDGEHMHDQLKHLNCKVEQLHSTVEQSHSKIEQLHSTVEDISGQLEQELQQNFKMAVKRSVEDISSNFNNNDTVFEEPSHSKRVKQDLEINLVFSFDEKAIKTADNITTNTLLDVVQKCLNWKIKYSSRVKNSENERLKHAGKQVDEVYKMLNKILEDFHSEPVPQV